MLPNHSDSRYFIEVLSMQIQWWSHLRSPYKHKHARKYVHQAQKKLIWYKFYLFENFLNQACAGHSMFLEIILMLPKYVHVCVCPPPRPQITSGVILPLNDWLNNFGCFSVEFYGSCH